MKFKLILLNFLEFAVWGAYLTSQGRYLAGIGLAEKIGWFYSIQGIVSIFMPALMGIVADKWIPAQKVLSLCHFLAGGFMIAAGLYGHMAGEGATFGTLFTLYACSVAFYMPTLGLNNSVSYNALTVSKMDIVKDFPPIRVFGTIGFICSMWFVDLTGYMSNSFQYAASGVLSIVLALFALTLPACPMGSGGEHKSIVDKLGLRAFALFKDYRMAVFFIFSMMLGIALQITNSFANPYLENFGQMEQYEGTFGVEHSNILISLSQVSETLCILLIPFFLRKFGIKKVMLISMLAWTLRFAFLGAGNPGNGVWLFILSMIVYGVAFDFFNISGSIFVEKNTGLGIRNSAQGLFLMMTNGIGPAVGTLGAQAVVTARTAGRTGESLMSGWSTCWYIFAAYTLALAIIFTFVFKYNDKTE